MIDPGLTDRVALVTGANHGIGAAVARALAAQGVAVGITYLRLPAAANAADPGLPERYDRERARSGEGLARELVDAGARAGAVLMAEYARRHRARSASWGRIVTLTSGGPDGFPGEVSYGAAKAALDSYVMSASRELGRFGITANVVYPPATDTGWVTEPVARSVLARSRIPHLGQPDEVAEVVLFLASEQARFVTGNVVQMH